MKNATVTNTMKKAGLKFKMTTKPMIPLGKQMLKVVRVGEYQGQVVLNFNNEETKNGARKYEDIALFIRFDGASRRDVNLYEKLGKFETEEDILGKEVMVEVLESDSEKYPRKIRLI